MSEEDKKVIEDLLNVNPSNMSYEQLVSMQNGWWETLNLLSEQNKENKHLKDQLQQKENIIKEVREKVENFDVFKEFTFPLMKKWEEQEVKSSIDYEWNQSIKKPILEILDKVDKGE